MDIEKINEVVSLEKELKILKLALKDVSDYHSVNLCDGLNCLVEISFEQINGSLKIPSICMNFETIKIALEKRVESIYEYIKGL